jgi:fructosamine-3-kinase
MDDEVPNPADWAKAVATLHMRSMGKSPNGMFGFQASTHLAKFPVNNTWSQSWEALWAQQMHSMFAQEEEKHGRDEELERLKGLLFNEVIPRYLRPLETDGRSIQPCLVHSDLWPGNIKPKLDETEVCMFDSCGFWGHNEGKY